MVHSEPRSPWILAGYHYEFKSQSKAKSFADTKMQQSPHCQTFRSGRIGYTRWLEKSGTPTTYAYVIFKSKLDLKKEGGEFATPDEGTPEFNAFCETNQSPAGSY